MIPRKQIDIGWADLGYGVAACAQPGDIQRAQWDVENIWGNWRANLACLSVRSGFDALLSVLDFPQGSEIVVSALNIRDITRIIEAHGLVAVPVDIDPRTLAVSVAALECALTPQTRGILIAHLFGSCMPTAAIAEFARARNLFLIEDCAQAYTGDSWRGDPESDVSMFSFGPIKTATALGGAVLSFRDATLRDRVRRHQSQSVWPVQSRGQYLLRLLKYAGIVVLSNRVLYGLFVWLCQVRRMDHDQVLSAAVRGFAGGDFTRKIRQQPSWPLLRLLRRRIAQGEQPSAARRTAIASLAHRIPGAVGVEAEYHSHWVCPIRHPQADALIQHLLQHGFDATRGASSMGVVAPPVGRARALEAEQLFAEMLYLPMHEGMSARDAERLIHEIEWFNQSIQSQCLLSA